MEDTQLTISILEPSVCKGDYIDRIKQAKSVLCFTGSGISADSGLQTFRDAKGIWSNFNPLTLATKNGYLRNPEKAWKFYQERKKEYDCAEPNLAHNILAEMEKYYDKFIIATQNIDGLHQKAGNRNVVELHGNYNKYKCLKEDKPIKLEDNINNGIPRCECGSMIRPDVVFFNEKLDEKKFRKVYDFIYKGVDLCFIIGTKGIVAPANEIPIMTHYKGAFTIDINPEKSLFNDKLVDLRLKGKASEVLNEIWKQIE